MLALITNHVWHPTETFIRRHAENLSPGKTVVIASGYHPGSETDLPVFLIDPKPGSPSDLASRAWRRFARLFPPNDIHSALGGRVKRRLREFLRKNQVSVILANFMDSSLKFMPLAQELGIPFYVHAHGYDVSICLRSPYWQQRYREYNQAQGVIVVSQSMKRRLVGLGIKSARIHVIPYGVNVVEKDMEHPPREVIRLVAVGRMTGKKAPLLMLEAFRQAYCLNPLLRFDYVGDGALFNQAQEFVKQHSLTEVVNLHGYQPPGIIQQLMEQADIFAQHSITDPVTGDEEGLPVAILEAMAMALPVVSTRHAGIPEAVLEGETGFLVNEQDCQTMASHIANLAARSPLREEMGRAGWNRAKHNFSWSREKQELRHLLQFDQTQ